MDTAKYPPKSIKNNDCCRVDNSGSDITIHNVGINPTRSGIIDIVTQMDGNITLFNQTNGSEPTASIRVQYTKYETYSY